MIDFYNIVDRISQSYRDKIRSLVLSDGSVNFDILKHHSKQLTEEYLVLEWLKRPVVKRLYEVYLKAGNINEEIDSLRLYKPVYEVLVKEGVLILKRPYTPRKSKKQWVDIPAEIVIEIVDLPAFKNVKRDTFKQFVWLIVLRNKYNFLRSFLDDIEKRGTSSAKQISEIIELVEVEGLKFQEKWSKYISPKNRLVAPSEEMILVESKTKASKTTAIPEVDLENKTYYSRTIIDLRRNSKPEDFSLPLTEIVKGFIDSGFIGKVNTSQFLNLFTVKEMNNSDEMIHWKGTPWDLKEFTERLSKAQFTQELKGNEMWFVAQHCFKARFKFMEEVSPIPKFTTISRSKRSKNDNTEKLNILCDKLIDLIQNSK